MQHQHVGVGQQQVKALDQQDRQRGLQPAAIIIGFRARRDMRREPAVQHQHLPDHRQPHRADAGQHRNGGAELEAEREGAGGEADDERLPHDELRHQAECHPVVRTRDAVLRIGHHEGRQRQAAEIQRHDGIGRDPRRQQLYETGQAERDDRRHRAGHPAAAGQKAAQQGLVAAGAIFRDDLLRRRRDAEIHHRAEQQDPGPDIDVDAVVRTAHPARQQDLREISEPGRDHANEKDGAGQPPRQRGLAGAAQSGAQPGYDA